MSAGLPQATPGMVNPPLSAKGHLAYLDGLRALAAVFVVIHHCFIHDMAADVGVVSRFARGVFFNGHYAVDVFIVLSGFCLMIPVVRSGWQVSGGAGRFFARRARRILPPYYLAMGLSLLLIWTLVGRRTGTHWDLCLPVRPVDVLAHLALIQDIRGSTAVTINHAFWSISVEWRIYFLFPLLVLGWRRFGAVRTVTAAAGASAALWIVLAAVGQKVPALCLAPWGICPHYLLLFALGMFAADLAFSGGTPAGWREKLSRGVCLAVATLSLVAVAIFQQVFAIPIPWPLWDVCVGIWTLCLLFHVGASPGLGILRSALSWPPLAFVGTFAYSIYLIHALLIQVVWQYALVPLHLGPDATLWTLVLLGTPAILGASYVFFLGCERPFLSSRQKLAASLGPG